jgi:hypothetical protein
VFAGIAAPYAANQVLAAASAMSAWAIRKKIVTGVVRTEESLVLVSVRDEGVGLPAGFDPTTSKRLGLRLNQCACEAVGSGGNPAGVGHWDQF